MTRILTFPFIALGFVAGFLCWWIVYGWHCGYRAANVCKWGPMP